MVFEADCVEAKPMVYLDHVVERVFGAATNKGDLAIEIENKTDEYVFIDHVIEEGEFQKIAPIIGDTISTEKNWLAGVYAGKKGSSISLNCCMQGGSVTIVIICADNDISHYKISENHHEYLLGKPVVNKFKNQRTRRKNNL